MKNFFLNELRDRELGTEPFRKSAASLSHLIASEICSQIGTEGVVLIPILRAGLVLLPAFLEVFKSAPVGFFGIKRDEKTAKPHLYYENLPHLSSENRILLIDPMLATGGSAGLALERIEAKGGVHITLVCMIAAPEGIAAVKKDHPKVNLYAVAIDERLDGKKFIVPGLGDFGDRYFGTLK